jgi:hypothetical protein
MGCAHSANVQEKETNHLPPSDFKQSSPRPPSARVSQDFSLGPQEVERNSPQHGRQLEAGVQHMQDSPSLLATRQDSMPKGDVSAQALGKAPGAGAFPEALVEETLLLRVNPGGDLSPTSRRLVAEMSETVAPAKNTEGAAGFFARAMSAPAPKDIAQAFESRMSDSESRLDAEDMRLQAMRNLRQQIYRNASPAGSPAKQQQRLSRSASLPAGASMHAPAHWDIQELIDAREGAKKSLASLLDNLRADHPDLAAALLHLEWAAQDLGLKEEHSFKRAESIQSGNICPPVVGMFTRAMSISGEAVNEEDEQEVRDLKASYYE